MVNSTTPSSLSVSNKRALHDGSISVLYNRESSFDSTREKVWRRVDVFILPVVATFQLLSFLDRGNIANARIAGLQEDLMLNNHQYTIALTVTYVAIIAAEIPANLLLREAVLQVSFSTFPYGTLVIGCSGGAFSGLLAYGIIRMDGLGGRPGWAWIFILEGVFSILFGISTFFTLPHSPARAPFLSDAEKHYVISRLRETGAISRDDEADVFSWRQVGKAFTLPHAWMLYFICFFTDPVFALTEDILSTGAITYALAYFTPSIVVGLGYTQAQAQLYSVPPRAVAFFVTMITAYLSDHFGARGINLMFSSILMIIGLVLFLVSKSSHVKYGSLFLIVSGSDSAGPAPSTWNANNVAPYPRRATATAVTSLMTNSGGILATWLLGSLSPSPLYRDATITLLTFAVLTLMIAGINIAYLSSQNKRKSAIRATTACETEPPGLGDRSAWFIYSL
ncbi:hypothetical protein C0995_000408 [Termitomyces sp. Mi166|nr:hypothetical protein C0995_000408 [Termitomyces sp. Mi166\